MARVLPASVGNEKECLGAYAMERVAAGAHPPTTWLFEPAKRPDDTADYCLDCSFLLLCGYREFYFTVDWTGACHEGDQWPGSAQ